MEQADTVQQTGVATGSLTVKIWRRDRVALSQPINVVVINTFPTFEMYAGVMIPRLQIVVQPVASSGETTFQGITGGQYLVILALSEEAAQHRVYAVRGLNDDYQITVPNGGTETVEYVLETPYQSVQFLAYYLHTGDRTGIDAVSAARKNERDLADTLAKEDLAARCEVMKAAIREAYNVAEEMAIDQRRDILKLFMAPEFYFQGAQSAYPLDYLHEVLASLRQEMDSEKYQDWLFIPGTFVGYNDAEGEEVDLYNLAMVHKGGPHKPYKMDRWTGRQSSLSCKTYISTIDFKRTECIHNWDIESGGANRELRSPNWDIVVFGENRELRLNSEEKSDIDAAVVNKVKIGDTAINLQEWFAQPGKEWCVDGRLGGSLFKLDGIVFGLEVCLDHSIGRLKNYYEQVADKDEPRVQVHLIPSAGMDVEIGNIVANVVWNLDKEHCTVINLMSGSGQGRGIQIQPPHKVVPISDPGVEAYSTLFPLNHSISAPDGIACDRLTPDGKHVYSWWGYIVVYSKITINSNAV